MNEKQNKRREWVKTAAIIFLSVMLVLTFFSQTIMNYSLPEVAAQYVESGTITAKIRGTGTIETGDPYEVIVKETRKVSSVAVREGDVVQKGDVLLYLAEGDSTELEEAKKELEEAWDAYDLALLSADVSAGMIDEAGDDVSTKTYRQQISDAQSEVETAQETVDEWQEKVDALEKQIAGMPSNNADTTEETKAYNAAKKKLEDAEFAQTEAENTLEEITEKLEYEISVSSGDAVIAKLETKKQKAKKACIKAQTAAKKAKLAFDKAETALNNKVAAGDTTGTKESLENQLAVVQADMGTAQKELEEKEKNLTDLTTKINGILNLDALYETIVDAQEKVDELEEKASGGTITADIAGTVAEVNVTAGNTVSAEEPAMVLLPEGQGYTMRFSVTNEQAKRLAVGDVAELVNAWRYDDVAVTLASIKPDKEEPGKMKELTFHVTGDVIADQELSVSVGQKSANYDLIVPNSAIREDNNGKFILTVESKSSPLGNRYIATRVDVEVIAGDDTKTAISGGLYGYEFVITTSTKPVEAGEQVRLSDN